MVVVIADPLEALQAELRQHDAKALVMSYLDDIYVSTSPALVAAATARLARLGREEWRGLLLLLTPKLAPPPPPPPKSRARRATQWWRE